MYSRLRCPTSSKIFGNWHQFDFSEGLDPNMTYQSNGIWKPGASIAEQWNLEIKRSKFESFWDIRDFTFNNTKVLTVLTWLLVWSIILIMTTSCLSLKGSGWTDLGGECVVDNLQTLRGTKWQIMAGLINAMDFDIWMICSLGAKLSRWKAPYNNTFKLYSFSDGIYVTSGGWDETLIFTDAMGFYL